MHNFIKRSVCLFLTLALILGTLPLYAAASDDAPTYTGDTLVAVNTNFSDESLTQGRFTAQNDLGAQHSIQGLDSSGEGIFKVYQDPHTGRWMTVVAPDLPELVPAEDDDSIMAAEMLPDPMLSEHAVDDTFRLTSKDKSKMDMVCLYVGTYCTVWGTTSDDADIQLNAAHAQQIGEHFDDFFPEVTDAFGSYWYDADGDGRVAIMCYDIEHEYDAPVSTYTAGYFYSVDMLGYDKRINGILFPNYTPTNAMDCIHIDTYPLMSSGGPLQSVEDCYGTLVHEFQHMLNFSSCVENGPKPFMPSYLNEAFSMAAEHMICGASSTATRVSYFNDSDYIPGTSLTYWSNTLSNYSNSYLFGQYIRTRYGALNGDDGNTIFKTILQMHQTDPNTDFLSLIADLLDTTEQALITDFWCACYLKEETGNHGFQGERWADAISPYVAGSFSSTSAIYNGGAKFYDLTNGFTPASANNVTFIALNAPIIETPAEAPVLLDLTAKRLSLSEATISFTPNANGILHYSLTSRVITDKSEISTQKNISANVLTTFRINTLTEPDQTPTFYYYTEAEGAQSDLQSIEIPALAYPLTIDQPQGGTITASPAEPLAGDEVSLSIELSNGYQLKHFLLDGVPLVGESFTVSGDHTIGAVLTYHDYFALLTDSSANRAELYINSPHKGTAYLALYDAQTERMLEAQTFTMTGTNLFQIIYTEHDLTASTVKIFLVDENGAPMSDVLIPPIV